MLWNMDDRHLNYHSKSRLLSPDDKSRSHQSHVSAAIHFRPVKLVIHKTIRTVTLYERFPPRKS